MEGKDKKLNKPLILFSLMLVIFLALIGDPHLLPQEPVKSFGEGLFLYIFVLILVPILNLWFKALWNNVIPTIFHLREISYWESLGLLVLLTLLMV